MEPLVALFFVYMIRNRINGKIYIGKTKNLAQRWSAHKSESRNESDYVIHRAIRKYGVESFEFHALSTHATEEEAYEAERKAILDLRTTTREGGYNANGGGVGSFSPSVEVRQKIREANLGHVVTPETRTKLRESRLGFTHTLEAKTKMSITRKGRPKSMETKRRISEGLVGRPVSDETRAKLQDSCRKNAHVPLVTDELRERLRRAVTERWRKWREERGVSV